MRILTYPNLVTVLRFPLAVLFVLVEGAWARGAIVLVGGASDWLDGWLSRRLEQRSGFGELVDPIADKTFLVVVLSTFLLEGALTWWQFLLLLVRDLFTVVAWVVARLLRLRVRFASRPAGKLATVLQIVSALALVAVPPLVPPLVWITGAAGAAASVDYALAARHGLRRRARAS